MKVIFLDFDGVINNRDFRNNNKDRKNPSAFQRDLSEIDPEMVAKIQQIIDATDAKIVISSSWRLIRELDHLRSVLMHLGLGAEVIDFTPHFGMVDSQRGDEICAWLSKHPEVTSFVVIDDSKDMRGVFGNLVRTHDMVGIRDRNVLQAIKILNR